MRQEYELQYTPLECITRALKQYGPIIRIHRNGHVWHTSIPAIGQQYMTALTRGKQTIFLTSKEYTQQILTDENYFSFESGMAKVSNFS
jgi:hypothetical protein